MSGHSKWNNIKRKKEKTDAQRAKVFTKVGKEITVAVNEGGPDPNNNGKLRDVIAKAKAANVPNENIERIIKKAAGSDKTNYESITYEGYGAGGIAVIVETLTDNRNRTAADIRHYFDKYGGNLGTTGCVSFMFTRSGIISLNVEGKDLDAVMDDVLEAGASDVNFDEEGVAVVTTEPNDLRTVREYLEGKGYTYDSAEIEYVPSNYTRIDDPDTLKNLGVMFEHLDDCDDVQDYWHNLENEDDLPD